MKKFILILLLTFGTTLFAQKQVEQEVKYVKITQKKCLKKSGYQMVLKELISDSRCPEGVNCIWAGEVTVLVSVYKNKKFIEDKTISISIPKTDENTAILSKYMPSSQKIKSVDIFPYPKKGVVLDAKSYYIRIGYLK